jgi:hypothetical protein
VIVVLSALTCSFLLIAEHRRQRLRLAAQADRLTLVPVEVALEVLERQREVQDVEIARSRGGERVSDKGADRARAIRGPCGERPSQDEACAGHSVHLNRAQLIYFQLGTCHVDISTSVEVRVWK